MHMSGFECFVCGARQPAAFPGYICPVCGGNLNIQYDYTALAQRRAAGTLWNEKRHDIFRYEAFLPIQDASRAAPLRVGMTPLYQPERLAKATGLAHLYVKDDGLNPSASFKDRAGAVALVCARERGAAVVAGASTGNAGSSMACLAASVGQPCVIFVPEKAPAAKIAQLLVFGAKVLAVRGTYDEAFDLCMQVCEKRGWFNRNTGFNPFTREGKKTCSFEIAGQLGWRCPDWVVVPVGDGNIISGIWKGFCDLQAAGVLDRRPRLLCAQSENSAAISQTIAQAPAGFAEQSRPDWRQLRLQTVAATTVADSISVDLPRDGLAAARAVLESKGRAITVSDEAILAAIPELARGAGVFAEPAAACAWAALKKAAAQKWIRPEETVVCLVTGNGLKDIASARKAAGEPTVIEKTLPAAEKALDQLL